MSNAAKNEVDPQWANPARRGPTGTVIANPAGTDPDVGQEDFQVLMDEVGTAVSKYCRQRPTAAVLGIFAIGFFVGWQIKPW